MKTYFMSVLAALLFACALAAQSTTNSDQIVFSGTVPIAPKAPIKDPSILVEYTTEEPCYECGTRYAVFCSPPVPDCGIPQKTVQHFEPFESEEVALEFMKTRMPGKFIRLLRVVPVPVKVIVRVKEVPQPPKVVENTEYLLGGKGK